MLYKLIVNLVVFHKEQCMMKMVFKLTKSVKSFSNARNKNHSGDAQPVAGAREGLSRQLRQAKIYQSNRSINNKQTLVCSCGNSAKSEL